MLVHRFYIVFIGRSVVVLPIVVFMILFGVVSIIVNNEGV
jgi:hypothetical protein